MYYNSRRDFIKTAAIGGLSLSNIGSLAKGFLSSTPTPTKDLYLLAQTLMQQWADGLLALQVKDKTSTDYGGIYCPADKAVHGRVGDTIFPFFYLANKTGDSKFTDAAYLLYDWIERRVSRPDGSWLNETYEKSWKGTTVFAAIALAETLKNYSDLANNTFKTAVSERLIKAGNYVYDNFNMQYGNINYPVTAGYGLSLLGTILDVPKFKQRGKELAYDSLKYYTPKNKFLYGEGRLTASPKGCYAVDLGYNVEESLPSLVMYGLLNNDNEILDTVTETMKAHLEFMLPDGGWDNSWGTRNYKWTYWGSRTSDGCQSAYALMAHRDPRFYKAALLNTQLMHQCTVNGLLQGGPHYASHGITPCVHHTFSHIKALTTMLQYSKIHEPISTANVILPKEENYGSRFVEDLQIYLISKGGFKATITAYDTEYKDFKNGHPTGGALSMLWHAKTGPLLSGSMNEYQIYEFGNQQQDTDPYSMALTPRIELKKDDKLYMNISDLTARMEIKQDADQLTVNTFSKLVDKNQTGPSTVINCEVSYTFANDKTTIRFKHDKTEFDGDVKIIVPVISKSTEKTKMLNDRTMMIKKNAAKIKVTTDQPMVTLPTCGCRIFNYVPGLEAVPLHISGNECTVQLEIMNA
ncbi:hypothetical protein [Mucilaginibacter agri]|uniref:Twin-arginine translocation signal domain-containing protein n=1 Tax=Mucilaginibacter agri TaxID=2695265 RepID=A0A965ZLI5_9SPHI|nr:hypothetical protein [Mucilaginibacter agri]NCD72149.1 hypothetical protein [Mucilaginibacter agri]